MKKTIQSNLQAKHEQLQRSSLPSASFSLCAVKMLMNNPLFERADWASLGDLAKDLKAANELTISLARKWPAVFHPNVIRSRQAENRVYDTVLSLASKH